MTAVSAAQSALEPTYQFRGREIATPVVSSRAVACSATFIVSAQALRRLVGCDDIRVAEVAPGRSLLGITSVSHLEGDLGRYHEFSLAAYVRRADRAVTIPYVVDFVSFLRSSLYAYCFRFAVNDEFARDCSAGIWGHPARIDEIDIERIGTRQQTKLVMDGEHVLTFSVPFGGKRTTPVTSVRQLSHVDEQLCETTICAKAHKVGTHLGGARMTLGNHALSSELRTLGLPKMALASVWTGQLERSIEAPFPCPA